MSEIAALSDTTFLVDERDGNFPAAGGLKKLLKIDLTGATDVGPSEHVAGATYDAAGGGLVIGGQTIEKATKGEATAQAQTTLQGDGITPVTSTQYVDIDALLLSLDPQARFFDHDKVEGVAALDGGRQIVVSNDSDFGISGIADGGPPTSCRPRSTRRPDSRTTGSTSRSKRPSSIPPPATRRRARQR